MSNAISFVGRLAADAEMKQLGGTTVLEFRVANNTGFGEREVTNWFSCKLWGKRGEKLETMLTKGKQVFITGELSLKPWTTREGVERLAAEINVNNLDFVGSREGAAASMSDEPQYGEPAASAKKTTAGSSSAESEVDDGELPF